jgi:GT2 family glycosyltransferase
VIIPTLEMALPITDNLIDQLVNCESVKKIIIINNREKDSFSERYQDYKKLQVIHNMPNLFVNPAWNYGMSLVDTKYYLLLNDDLLFNGKIIDYIIDVLEKRNDLNLFTIETVRLFLGVSPNYKQIMSSFQNEKLNPIKYEIKNYPEMRQGWFMLARTESWEPIDIPKFELIMQGDDFTNTLIMRGDDFIHKKNQEKYQGFGLVTSNFLYHCESTTVNQYLERKNTIEHVSKKMVF